MNTDDDIRAVNRAILLARRTLETTRDRLRLAQYNRDGSSHAAHYIMYTRQIIALQGIEADLIEDLRRYINRRNYLENLERGYSIPRSDRSLPPAA